MFPRGIFFLARVSVCITVGVSVGVWFFLFATELATEMGFTDDWFTDGALPSVNPSVLFSPTDLIAVTDGINPSVKLDNVVVSSAKFQLPLLLQQCMYIWSKYTAKPWQINRDWQYQSLHCTQDAASSLYMYLKI
jgi:hypothetical protein